MDMLASTSSPSASSSQSSSGAFLIEPSPPKPARLIIAIDGPAGTGKSSVARELARRLGLEFLDTGAMYRAAAALVIDARLGIEAALAAGPLPPELVTAVCDLVASADLRFEWKADPPELLARGASVMGRIREPDVTALVSPLAGVADLRASMVAAQRTIAAAHPRLVAEGRDQGSVVFPDACVKFYLHASPTIRAARRADQLKAAGIKFAFDQLLAEIVRRDESDRSRVVGPLVCPPDALVVDTSTMTLADVVDHLENLVRQRTLQPEGGAAGNLAIECRPPTAFTPTSAPTSGPSSAPAPATPPPKHGAGPTAGSM